MTGKDGEMFMTRSFIVTPKTREQFLARDAMHKRGLCRHAVSDCVSVWLSVCKGKGKCIYIAHFL